MGVHKNICVENRHRICEYLYTHIPTLLDVLCFKTLRNDFLMTLRLRFGYTCEESESTRVNETTLPFSEPWAFQVEQYSMNCLKMKKALATINQQLSSCSEWEHIFHPSPALRVEKKTCGTHNYFKK